MKPTLGSLFAGIGGIDLGFERAGFETKWQVEIDPFCRKVLAKNFPNADRSITDVRCGNAATLSRVDVVAGGFPCQDISIAGNREGLEGNRSGLWFEYKRVISELRPKYVVIENVNALLSPIRKEGRPDKPAPIVRVLQDLAEIGYDAEWQVLQANAFGVPQPRKRLFMLAYPPRERMAGLFQSVDIDSFGQGREGCTTYLQQVADSPFRGCDSFPQPLFRRVDDRPANWVDRVRACGNAVVPQIAEFIAKLILKDMEFHKMEKGAVSGTY